MTTDKTNVPADTREIIETALAYLPRLSRAVTDMAGKARFTLAENVGANKETEELAEGLGWAAGAMRIIAGGGARLREEEAAKMAVALKSAIDAAMAEDYVLFADMLEFEINPIIDDWFEILEGLVA